MDNSQRRLNLVRIFNSAPVFDQVRGGSTLQTMAKQSVYGDMIDLYEPADGKILVPGNGVIFCDLSVAIGTHETELAQDLLRGQSNLSKLPLILDVHFPFWDAERVIGLQQAEEVALDEEKTDELREFWSDPRNVDLAVELVQHADVVTASQVPWADYVLGLNPNTYHLLDVHNPMEAVKFTRTLLTLLGTAFRHRYLTVYGNKISWTDRLRLRAQGTMIRATYRISGAQKRHVQELEKLEWKFQ